MIEIKYRKIASDQIAGLGKNSKGGRCGRQIQLETSSFAILDGKKEVTCGVTIAALKEYDSGLQRHGLVPAEAFLASFEKLMLAIHDAARHKYDHSDFEPEGPVRIMVHRRDLSP